MRGLDCREGGAALGFDSVLPRRTSISDTGILTQERVQFCRQQRVRTCLRFYWTSGLGSNPPRELQGHGFPQSSRSSLPGRVSGRFSPKLPLKKKELDGTGQMATFPASCSELRTDAGCWIIRRGSERPPHLRSYDYLLTLQDCQPGLRRELLEMQRGVGRARLGNDGDGRCDRHSSRERSWHALSH